MQLRFSPLGPLARGRSGSPGPGLALPFEPRGPGRLLPPRGWGREGAAAARAVPAVVSEGASTRLLPGRETPTVTPRLPRSARVRCVRPARSAPTSSTRCPSPRPSGQPLGSGRCEPPPSLGAGLDSAPEGVRSLGGAPVAERLLGLLFRTGARPGQRPGIPGPRHGSRSVSEHGPLTDQVARDRPSGPGCRCTPGPAEVTPVPGLGDRVRRLEAPVRHLRRRGRVDAALGPCALAVATLHRDPLRPRARGPSGL